ncbi:sulfatase-like hydrolase/transferase [bacterium]|nr:sulfatase-like hydrolase/transferase [bacterium]
MLASIEVRAQQRPNIVFFLVDDLGQRDVACYGSQFYETPSIDALAKDGLLFENANSTPATKSSKRAAHCLSCTEHFANAA